jgi:hypothetical protein
MDPVEYLPLNAELRSHSRYFRDHEDCVGVTWNVNTADQVKAGEVIGQFNFEHHPPAAIVAPVDAVIVGTYTPEIAYLPYPPSMLVALLRPTQLSDGGQHVGAA